jgi:hypothetical protein
VRTILHRAAAAPDELEPIRFSQFNTTAASTGSVPLHTDVNLIECFFSILSKQGFVQSVQHSRQDLKELLNRFIASYNETCNPFTWTKGSEHLQRNIETTKEYQALHPRKPRRRRAKRRKVDSIKN